MEAVEYEERLIRICRRTDGDGRPRTVMLATAAVGCLLAKVHWSRGLLMYLLTSPLSHQK